MTTFRVSLHVNPRQGLLDPQGKAVADALRTLDFTSVKQLWVGRHLLVELEARDSADAERQARAMCEKLLANPVTEDFEIAGVTKVGT